MVTSKSNEDLEVICVNEDHHHLVKVKAKSSLTLLKADDYLEHKINFKDTYFLNGYQSWTDTDEFYLSKRLRNIKKSPHLISHMFAMDKYGDATFYRYSIKKSHGYDVFYSKGKNECFLYSLNFKTAYLVIELIKDSLKTIHLISDVKNIALKKEEEVDVFNYYFYKSYQEGINSFNEHFPRLNKEKIFGYTSWYNYYQNISEAIILRDLDALDSRFNVFQIDDGYETFVGDWLDIDKKKFPNGLEGIVKHIHQKGYKAGIWLAPYAVEAKSITFKNHQDWLVKDEKGKLVKAGGNWSGFYVLDLYNEEAMKYMKKCLKFYMDLGFDFFKLDFLYAAALVPVKGKSRAQVQQESYDLLREILGDKLILGCGANLSNSYQVFDYLRIGPDVSLKFDDVAYMRLFHRERPSTKATLKNTIYRSIFNDRFFGNDPDVFLLRDENIGMTLKQRRALTRLNALFGSVFMTSDDIATYDDLKKDILSEDLNLFYNAKVKSITRLNKKQIRIEYELEDKIHTLIYHSEKGVILKDE